MLLDFIRHCRIVRQAPSPSLKPTTKNHPKKEVSSKAMSLLHLKCLPFYTPHTSTYKSPSPSLHPLKPTLSLQLKAKLSDSRSDQHSIQDNVAVKPDTPTSTSFLSFLCPLLNLFSAKDPSQQRNYAFEEFTSFLSSLARLPWGSTTLQSSSSKQDISTSEPQLLQLYEFEACPFCRRVREAMTELDLSAEVFPCPKGSLRHRDIVRKIGGKEQFPFLVDPNEGISLYESGDIVNYLYKQYGEGRSPSIGLLESTLLTGWMPTILRAGRGMSFWEKAKIDPSLKKLELFSYENNPYARLVREALCELELPYILHNVGTGSSRAKLLLDISGLQEVPYMIDPNTGAQMGDYKKILAYLFETYSAVAT